MPETRKHPSAQDLHALARSELVRAYAPYSSLKVAAAIATHGGQVVTGVNVENASSPLGICAERTAVFRAVAEGHTRFVAIALAGTSENLTPCGACRQVLYEFASEEMTVTFLRGGELVTTTLAELLPEPYRFDR